MPSVNTSRPPGRIISAISANTSKSLRASPCGSTTCFIGTKCWLL
ncbi:Uncharacterised protein [Vibrio cholerae]|nr:Uncharacterised protein [Vibrio cholerae]